MKRRLDDDDQGLWNFQNLLHEIDILSRESL